YAEGVDCLLNEEIFAELARMGYEKPSTKLTFYKAFFSSQWKFLIHTILQLMSAKRTSWNEFSSTIASAIICLSTGDDTAAHGEVPTVSQEPSIPSPTPPTPPPQPPQDLPSTSQLKRRVKKLEKGNRVKVLKLRRLKRVGTSQRIDTSDDNVMDDESNQGRIIDEMDKDDVVALMDDKEEDKKDEKAKVDENDHVQGRQTESQAKIYKIDMDHASKVLSMQEDEPAEVQEVVDVVTTAKLITEVVTAGSETGTVASIIISTAEPQVHAATITAAPSRRRKGVDKGKEILVEEPKPLKKKQQIEMDEEYARNLHVELNKDIEINETPTERAAKRRKLNKEVEDLKRHLEIVPDIDNDVYTEATPLARMVLIVDYEIIEINNKPYYKFIRADGTHQLYISFLTLLKNINREDLEALWNLVKERFSTSKPKNFSDDFLLTTLRAMFKKPDAQAQVWKNQKTIHGQAKVKSYKLLESCGVHIITFSTTQMILLVERRYPLSRFTLDQMLNAVRLQVKEESEMSLELLSVAGEELSAAKQKLMLLDSVAEERVMLPSHINAANVILMLARQS
nr:hypothetical protein [Tanacetum cinerariifolium]